MYQMPALMARYDAQSDGPAFLLRLAEEAPHEAEELARALARRALGRETCADLDLPPLVLIDDEAAIRLAVAVCERARLDAGAGLLDAGAWLAGLQATRPRSLRLLGDAPVERRTERSIAAD